MTLYIVHEKRLDGESNCAFISRESAMDCLCSLVVAAINIDPPLSAETIKGFGVSRFEAGTYVCEIQEMELANGPDFEQAMHQEHEYERFREDVYDEYVENPDIRIPEEKMDEFLDAATEKAMKYVDSCECWWDSFWENVQFAVDETYIEMFGDGAPKEG